jgi:hypothetical protein
MCRGAQGLLGSDSGGLQPRFVQQDEKLPATVWALGRGKENHLPWPIAYRLLLAVRTFDLMTMESKIDEFAFRHDLLQPGARIPPRGQLSRAMLALRSRYPQDADSSVR